MAITIESIYGQRAIAYSQSDISKRSKTFWNVVLFRMTISLVTALIYVFFVSFFIHEKKIYLILVMNIIAVAFDISWFFQGIEDFKRIVLRDSFFKIVGVLGIFILVKSKDDLILYVALMSGIVLFSAMSLWGVVQKYVEKPKLSELSPFSDWRTIISLFIPTIAIQVYTVLDKTMIGLITSNNYENGYYEQAVKISRLTLTIVTALGTVMIPRIGSLFAQKKSEQIQKLMYRGYRFVWMIGIPLCFGLIGISDNFVPWFFGKSYMPVSSLLKITALIILAIGINNVTGVQFLIPTGRQNLFTKTVIYGAILNFIMNSALIPFWGAKGAAIASVAAETMIAIIQFYYVRSEIEWKVVLVSGWKYLIAGLVMLSVICVESNLLKTTILDTMIIIATGVTVYVVFLVILRDSYFISEIKSMLLKLKTQ